MEDNGKINTDWKDSGFDPFQKRTIDQNPKQGSYISGAKFDALLDNMLFNRMIRLKGLVQAPQGNDPGKIYWDSVNKKYKIWIDSTGKWCDVVYTSTSTSTTSTSTS